MLLSSLITRTFGVKASADEHDALNGLSRREFFKKYPKLQQFLLQKLETGRSASDDQRVNDDSLMITWTKLTIADTLDARDLSIPIARHPLQITSLTCRHE
jgi:hypothetical protein